MHFYPQHLDGFVQVDLIARGHRETPRHLDSALSFCTSEYRFGSAGEDGHVFHSLSRPLVFYYSIHVTH